MATFTGNFQYTGRNGTQQEGPCRIDFDKETFTLTAESGPPLSFDLGDIDGILSERHQLRLPLYTEATLLLNRFGSSYDNLARELTKAHREREVQCLLLADMPEIARFDGHFERVIGGMRCASCGAAGVTGKFCRECGKPLAESSATAGELCANCGARGQSGKFCHECGHALSCEGAAPASSGEAEVRLYKTNLAILPEQAPGFQMRLGDVQQVRPEGYNVFVDFGDHALKFSALGKRTQEFADKLQAALTAMRSSSSQALHQVFPFLNPDQLQQVATMLPEGASVCVRRLEQVDARMGTALTGNALDKDLQPYYAELAARAGDAVYAGFKLIRAEEQQASAEQEAEPEDDGDAGDADQKGPDALYWFFFPLAKGSQTPKVVAWEASSRGGRATYFFRVDPKASIEEEIRRLNRGLGTLNFRRRPIYLSDDELAMNPIFRRYAIAGRRIPEVRQLRAAFLGRAIHSSLEAWQEQVKGIVENV